MASYNVAVVMGPRASLIGILAASILGSCGGTPIDPPKAEHEARQLSPVPACATVLPAAGPQGMRASLHDEYWKLVYPAFDDHRKRLPPDALACTGDPVLRTEAFRGGSVITKLTEGEITYGGGADGIKLVWLRSHSVADDQVAGAVALVRLHDEFAYVVAVGAHRGRPDARISMDRLGSELVLLVRDEGCRGRKPGQPCRSLLTVYLVRQGRLVQGAIVALEQVAIGDGEWLGEPGMTFHLTAAPSFVNDELRVVEHVSVKNRVGREVRWAEQQRVFVVMGDVLEPSDTPLWSRVVQPRDAKRE